MDLPTFLIVMLSAVCHASWNALLRARHSIELVLGMALLGALVGGISLFLLPAMSSSAISFLVYASAFHIGSRLSSQMAYSRGDMTQVYPLLRGAIPVITALLAYLLAAETISGIRVAALIIIAVGVAMLAFRGGVSPTRIEFSVVFFSLLLIFS